MLLKLRTLALAGLLLHNAYALTIQKLDVEVSVEVEDPSSPPLVEDFVDGITLAPLESEDPDDMFIAEPVCTAFDTTGPVLHCDLLTRPCCTQCRCTAAGTIECKGATNGQRQCTMCDYQQKRRGCTCRPANSKAEKTVCKTAPGPSPPKPPPVVVNAKVKTNRINLDAAAAMDQISLAPESEVNPLAWTITCSSLYKPCEQCCGCGNGPAKPLCSKRDDCASRYAQCIKAVNTNVCRCENR